MRLLFILTVVGSMGCVGEIDTPHGSTEPTIPTRVSVPTGMAAPTPFVVPPQDVQLLPFKIRFSKLQSLVGAGANDPIFAELLAARAALGDYNYAAGIPADNSWTALRITQWVVAMKPVCASQAMKIRYADLPGNLTPLLEAAYGRSVTAEERTAYDESLAGLTLTAAQRYESICLAVLSSMEFLAL